MRLLEQRHYSTQTQEISTQAEYFYLENQTNSLSHFLLLIFQ